MAGSNLSRADTGALDTIWIGGGKRFPFTQAGLAAAVAAAVAGEIVHVRGALSLTLTASMEIPDGVTLDLHGATLTRADANTFPTFATTGSLGAAVALASDAAEGALTVTLADGSGFSAGDVVYLVDTEYGTSAVYGLTDGVKRYVGRVVSVAGNVLTLAGALPDTFKIASGATCAKVTTKRATIRGRGTHVGTGTFYTATYFEDVHIEGAEVSGWQEAGAVALARGTGFSARQLTFHDPSATTSDKGYGISCDAVSHGVVHDVQGRNTRHLVILGNSACHITGGNFVQDGAVIDTLNMHGANVRHVQFDGVVCSGSRQDSVVAGTASAPDKYVRVTGIVSHSPARGAVVTSGDVEGCHFEGRVVGARSTANPNLSITGPGNSSRFTMERCGYGSYFEGDGADHEVTVIDHADSSSTRYPVHYEAPALSTFEGVRLRARVIGGTNSARVCNVNGAGQIRGLDVEVYSEDAASYSLALTNNIDGFRARVIALRGAVDDVLLGHSTVQNGALEVISRSRVSGSAVNGTGTNVVQDVTDNGARTISGIATVAGSHAAAGATSDQSALGLDAPRQPSTTRDTFVEWSAAIACDPGDTGSIVVLRDSANPPTTERDRRGLTVSATATGATTVRVGGSFIVRAGDYYELETSSTNTPTFTLLNLQETPL